MAEGYAATRDRLEVYFDQTARQAWERLTSDAPVSRIRQTVREGRDRMRAQLLGRLPADLTGARVLDAGCGAGQMATALATRGADVLAVDISPRLLDAARARTPTHLAPRIRYVSGDMLDASFGSFDAIVAMDSLIHYTTTDAADALATLAGRSPGASIVFTVAPQTPLLAVMHAAGRFFPRGNRAPSIVPVRAAVLSAALDARCGRTAATLDRVTSGFYISQAMEVRPCA
jgi:magnesium-protoporphyrin O-methyltransferase